MRLTAIFLVLLMATGTASAEWFKVGEADEATYYIDPSSIKVDGHIRRAWTLTDKKQRNSDGLMSSRYREEYDCKNKVVKVISYSAHSEAMASGKTLRLGEVRGKWIESPPNTTGETMYKFVCSK